MYAIILDVLSRLKSRDSEGHPLSGGLPRTCSFVDRMVIKHQDHRARQTPTTGNPRYLPVDIESTRSAWPSKPQQQEYQPRCLRLDFFFIPQCGHLRSIFLTATLTAKQRGLVFNHRLSLSGVQALIHPFGRCAVGSGQVAQNDKSYTLIGTHIHKPSAGHRRAW